MLKNINNNYMLIFFGPTGVGKTDVALECAHHLPVEIVNIDVGQFYTPLSIGTAKPDWRNQPVEHHLFDIVDKPVDVTVIDYRKKFFETVEQIWKHHKIPLVVGGSCFYLHALFFPPRASSDFCIKERYVPGNSAQLWEQLNRIDPERAAHIHPHDTYRIKRALEIWHVTGKKPSEFIPVYDPPSPYTLICLTRDREDLYNRINTRTEIMMKEGWIDEVKSLQHTPWEQFLRTKKLIGYSEIFDYLEGKRDLQDTISIIQQETRNYAKRQLTFWRRLEKQLCEETLAPTTSIKTVDLTTTDLDLYIKQLSEQIKTLIL